MNRARWPGVFAVTVFGLLAVGSQAIASEGGLGIRLVDVPASSAADPRAHLYVTDHLAPGAIIERRVEVSNTTAGDIDVLIYAAAADIDHGTFIGAAGHTANDLSSWTTVTPGDSVLAAGTTATIVVTIAVPSDAAPGERYGVVWAEARSGDATGGGVVEVNRVGIRLYISVGPGGPPAADFTITSLTASRSSDGAPVLSATVNNTGGRALDISGSLQLTGGPDGLSAGPFPATLGVTLAVDATEEVHITLGAGLPNGPWHASIVLRSGLTERSANAVVNFPPSGSAPPVAVASSSDSGSWLLIALMVAIAAVLVLAAALVFARRRHHASGGNTARG